MRRCMPIVVSSRSIWKNASRSFARREWEHVDLRAQTHRDNCLRRFLARLKHIANDNEKVGDEERTLAR